MLIKFYFDQIEYYKFNNIWATYGQLSSPYAIFCRSWWKWRTRISSEKVLKILIWLDMNGSTGHETNSVWYGSGDRWQMASIGSFKVEISRLRSVQLGCPLKLSIFIIQKAAATKNGVEFSQKSIDFIRCSQATAYDDVQRQPNVVVDKEGSPPPKNWRKKNNFSISPNKIGLEMAEIWPKVAK